MSGTFLLINYWLMLIVQSQQIVIKRQPLGLKNQTSVEEWKLLLEWPLEAGLKSESVPMIFMLKYLGLQQS